MTQREHPSGPGDAALDEVADRLRALEASVRDQRHEARLTFTASLIASVTVFAGGIIAAMLLANAAEDSAAAVVRGDQTANQATIHGDQSAFMAEQRREAYGSLAGVAAQELREIQLYRDRSARGAPGVPASFGHAHERVRKAAWDTLLVGDYPAKWRAYCLVRSFEKLPDMWQETAHGSDASWKLVEDRLDGVQKLINDLVRFGSEGLFADDADARPIEPAECPAMNWGVDIKWTFTQ